MTYESTFARIFQNATGSSSLHALFRMANQSKESVKRRPKLFTKKKPVGSWFVQMISQNSRMGDSVGIGVYHLHNSFEFTERVWREAKSWGNASSKHAFRLEISLGNFGLPFKKSRFLRKISVWDDQNRFTIYIPTEISGFFW